MFGNLSNNVIAISILFFFMLNACGAPAQSAPLTTETQVVASQLIAALRSKDRSAFEQLFSSEDNLPTNADYNFYFGLEEPSRLRRFFLNPSIDYSIFNQVDNSVVIVYFRSDLVDKPTVLDWELIGSHWLELYAATEIIKKNNRWNFDQTPFYLFRHAPWAHDYG
ncbi:MULTISPECIES: hypothetical protein [Gammaproteobacteria]|uniref:hypothetical protein n=1 Tax=Gammaproteobacteria TaxID=1236 RepID=UPI000DCFA495|nr:MULTISPECIES: hypothetical protein [Gammaproteobacteria]RTE86459.1 hypothetical protein DQX04_07840 [Aliidiomarina sp. B3213]TCZ90986.1 hypothetical protein EYQ95_09205 [Lysobacter sp. N42]